MPLMGVPMRRHYIPSCQISFDVMQPVIEHLRREIWSPRSLLSLTLRISDEHEPKSSWTKSQPSSHRQHNTAYYMKREKKTKKIQINYTRLG